MSKPVLAHTIEKLMDTGCKQIVINVHHLHDQITDFIQHQDYTIDIKIIYEPTILDTGGAIANAEPFLHTQPFFVINSDIISTVDLAAVFEFHKTSNALATLVLHNYNKFNKVEIDPQGFIKNFNASENGLAFTGIQVLSPEIYQYFPNKKVFSSIDIYQQVCQKHKVKAFIEKDIYWSDIGTKDSYALTSIGLLAASQFGVPHQRIKDIEIQKLAGDGSDRKWYRVSLSEKSYIISDHGICLPDSDEHRQLNAFIHIGNHLFSKKLPVPEIFNHDTLSGMVILRDLGDTHLESLVLHKQDDDFTLKIYKKAIDRLIDFSTLGRTDFDPCWTCQTPTYSKELIIEKECRYFMDEFINAYLKKNISFNSILTEFEFIAQAALKNGVMGLMHRDMQSKNIMVVKNDPYFIDFQAARIGPLQYDLASLLIDPYVALEDHIQEELLNYAIMCLNITKDRKKDFLDCYHYCCLTRNLQFLGAFSFLSQVKNKSRFENHIPAAVKSLKKIMNAVNIHKLPRLANLIQNI